MYKKTKEYFTAIKHEIGGISKNMRLAASGLRQWIWEYWKSFQKRRKRDKQFTCTACFVCCFLIGNDFAGPVFQKESSSVSNKEEASAAIEPVILESFLSDEWQIVYDQGEMPENENILEKYLSSEYEEVKVFDVEEEKRFLSKALAIELDAKLKEDLDKNIQEDIIESKRESGNIELESVKEEVTLGVKKDSGKKIFDKDDWKLVLINKQHPIPTDYSFTLGPIKTVKGTMKCDERITEDLLSMMKAAGDEGVNLAICSPYRDLNWQEFLFNRKIKSYMKQGMSYMEAYKVSSQAVTVPGTSEHQVGLALDIVSDNYLVLDTGFADTPAGIWLKDNCAEYGFILRYPEGKEDITGIEFEPWHFRYVGKEAAKVIMEEDLCLEEFWDKYM